MFFEHLMAWGQLSTMVIHQYQDKSEDTSGQRNVAKDQIAEWISGTWNGGTEPYNAILGVGFSLT